MNPRAILIIALAALGIIIFMLLTRSFLSGAQQSSVQQQTTEQETIRIWVAKTDLPVGTLIKQEHLEAQRWPKKSMNLSFIKEADQANQPTGMVVRLAIAAGQPLVQSALVAAGDRGFLAAALQPGMRAATVQVTPTSGVSGFIFPGDRVDVILTHELKETLMDRGTPIAETVLQNVRVLGIDQRSNTGDTTAKLIKTVTLEVTPAMAEKIALLPSMGSLSLALRALEQSITDPGADIKTPPIAVTSSHTFSGDISNFINKPDEKKDVDQVRIHRGGKSQTIEFEISANSSEQRKLAQKEIGNE